jgi:hypothetical protein
VLPKGISHPGKRNYFMAFNLTDFQHDTMTAVTSVFLEREKQQTQRAEAEAKAQAQAAAQAAAEETRKYFITAAVVAAVAIAFIIVRKRG